MKSKAAWLVATWFGCGLSPFAPGTAGSLGALLPAMIATAAAPIAPWMFALAAVLLTPAGIWAATAVSVDTGKKDPQVVVIDEVLGQWITLAGAAYLDWRSYLMAFFLFRAFDIWKPPPVRQLERLESGTGIVADDLMAGVYGAAVLAVLTRIAG